MKLEVNKKYVDRDGCVWIVTTIGDTCGGVDEFGNKRGSMWYPDGNCYKDQRPCNRDLVSEYNELTWSWCTRDKVGLWAFGGFDYNTSPKIKNLSNCDTSNVMAWRCYFGPIPNISMPKKYVLWLCKSTVCMWEEQWIEEGKFPEGFKHDKSDMERFVKTERVK